MTLQELEKVFEVYKRRQYLIDIKDTFLKSNKYFGLTPGIKMDISDNCITMINSLIELDIIHQITECEEELVKFGIEV